ncbi:MAG: hypothetical protein ACOCXP_00300 [Candidatus Dojkabacteria bacterium]
MKTLILLNRLFTAREAIAAFALANALKRKPKHNSKYRVARNSSQTLGARVDIHLGEGRYPRLLREFLPLSGVKLFEQGKQGSQVVIKLPLKENQTVDSLGWQQNGEKIDLDTNGTKFDLSKEPIVHNILHYDTIYTIGFDNIDYSADSYIIKQTVSIDTATVIPLTSLNSVNQEIKNMGVASEEVKQLQMLAETYPYDNRPEMRKLTYSTRHLLELLDFWVESISRL